MESFSATYSEAREKFLAAGRDAGARLYSYGRDNLRGKEGERLACDVAVLGAADAEKAAIVISGTHGVEAFSASAIQHRWLRAHASGDRGVKIVLVHAVNPWAFSHKTRATENNVDLNRNFLADHDRPASRNSSYDRLAPFLHATSFAADECLAAHEAYRRYLDDNGWHIENEVWAGQRHRPDGICFSGTKPEWANSTFRGIVSEHLSQAKAIGFIDLHTGVGRYGEVVYLIFDEPGSAEHAAAESWWGRGDARGAFNAGAVPKFDGLLCKAIRQELPQPRIAGAVIEFGTVDDYSLFRADRLDRWLRFEGKDDPDRDRFLEDCRNALCPNDVAWRRHVLAEGPKIIDRLIAGVSAW